jgi:hypothetical protein
MTISEGFSLGIDGDDDDDKSDKQKTEKEKREEMITEINDAFDPDDFREKLKKLLDLYKEIEKTEGKIYIGMFTNMNRGIKKDIDYVKDLWDEDEDEWEERAYKELAETKFKKYNFQFSFGAIVFDEILEKAETDESYKKKYDWYKDYYGKTGITYIKRAISIVLDKDMDVDMDMDMDLGKKSSMGFF